MDIGSLYTDYYANQASDAKTNRLKGSLSNKDMSGASDEELMKVCKDFESYFVEQVLKQAVEVFTSGDEASSGSMSTLQSYYRDGLVKEYAEKVTENQEFGLAKTLYEQMKRNLGDSIPAADVIKAQDDTSDSAAADTTSAVEAASTMISEEDK